MSELGSFVRYAAGLRGFFRRTLTPEECRRRVREGLAAREANFLATLEHGVYAQQGSPYRALLAVADVELGDVRRLVDEQGLEVALEQLHDAGVRVSLEEFKGRRPIVRPGLELPLEPHAFDHPLLRKARYAARSGGSRGAGRRALVDFPHLEHEAAYQSLFLEAFDLGGRPRAFWRAVPPGGAGIKNTIGYAKLGLPVERWFSPNPLTPRGGTLREYLLTSTTLLASRLWSRTPLPSPQHVPVTHAVEVTRWLEALCREGRPALLDTTASSGVRVCAAAREHGLDIAGTAFRFGGEPLTEAKARIMAEAGARAVAHYSMSDVGRVGVACAAPAAVDDVHILLDKIAVVQRERVVGLRGAAVGALLLTTLLPSCPKLLLNVETDDYGVLERRSCGCELGEIGLDLHLHAIRSYEKLTSEGMHFLGTELISLVEEVLPARFGGTATDYQLVEEEVDGLPKVAIVVSPRVGDVDEGAVARVALEALAAGPAYRGMMAGIWEAGQTLRVVRREPYTSSVAAKILPLHVVERG